ncbi:MAG: hypothetical protein QXN87_04010 [Candidatus Bathyarchaeia archaeon]
MKKVGKKVRKPPKNKKAAIILMAIIVAITIIGLSAYTHTKTNSEKTKEDPNRYFQFLDAAAFGYHPQNSPNVIRIEMLYFKLKPIRGNATNVVIHAEGMMNPTDYFYESISKGAEIEIEITFESPIQIQKKENVYPVKIKVYSEEAEGYVTLELKDEDVIST